MLLKETFQKNGSPENFTDRCFKLFLNEIHIPLEKVPIFEKNFLRLVHLCLRAMSLQTRAKLQKLIKGVLNCCELQVSLKSQSKLSNNFCFKGSLP